MIHTASSVTLDSKIGRELVAGQDSAVVAGGGELVEPTVVRVEVTPIALGVSSDAVGEPAPAGLRVALDPVDDAGGGGENGDLHDRGHQ